MTARCARWRHLDLAGTKLWLQAEIRRIECPDCGVLTGRVPWARAASRFTTQFEDLVASLAQCSAKSTVATLMRCSWESVDRIVTTVVVEQLDDTRFDGWRRVSVDEISYLNRHHHPTVGHESADALIISIDLSLGGINIPLPTGTQEGYACSDRVPRPHALNSQPHSPNDDRSVPKT